MEIMRVLDAVVCSRRIDGLQVASLRLLQNQAGDRQVATDPVGVAVGKWVFTTTGSAARIAMPDPRIMTDLTICGIIDHWVDEAVDAA